MHVRMTRWRLAIYALFGLAGSSALVLNSTRAQERPVDMVLPTPSPKVSAAPQADGATPLTIVQGPVDKAVPPAAPLPKADGTTPVAVAQGQPDQKNPQKLPPLKVEAEPKTEPAPPVPLPDVAPPPANPITNGGVFGSPAVQGYRADSSTTGTKIDMPLFDYPGSLTVIPIDLLRDQNALTVNDILRNIPSAVRTFDFGDQRDAFFLRGFEMNSRDFRFNGFTDPSYVTRDFFNVDRVEVMTGPASVLYGAGSPSGTINFITKQPLDTPYNNFNFTFGSYNLTRYAVDTTGPIDGNGVGLYRINAFYQQNDSFRDFGWSQRTGVAPVFAILLSPDTVLSFEGSYNDTRKNLDTGLIYYNGAIQGPINRSFNEPSDYFRVDDYKSLLSLVHKFDGDNLTGRLQFFNDSYNFGTLGTIPDVGSTNAYNGFAPGFGLPALGPTQILREVNEAHLAEQYYDIRAELAAKFNGVFFKHNAVVGAEIGWYHSDFSSYQSDPAPGGIPFAPFNFANPVYGQTGMANLLPSDFAHIAQERYGAYFSDMIEVTERLKVLVGLRYDIVNTDFANTYSANYFGSTAGSFPLTIEDRVDYHLSPRVGIVWQPIPEVLSIYGTYVQSFDPPVTGVFAVPTTLLPETGTSGEIGAKLQLFEKKLTLQVAGYIIDKHNVVAQENFITSTQIGEIRSSGFEFSMIGQITREWSVVANYAYCDSRIVSDPADASLGVLPGERFRGVPYNTANVWTRYNLIDNDKHTLGVGLGFIYVGDRFGDLADDFVLPGYTRWDTGIFYQRGRFNMAAYIENIFNNRYYSGSFDANTIMPGTPINFRVMMGITF